jgi:hypothetical protein
MGKYSPLRLFLAEQDKEQIPMTFAEIEDLLGEKLPASKRYPAWWSNNPSNNPMTKEWLAAGFQTESVNVAAEKLTFKRVRKVSGSAHGRQDAEFDIPNQEDDPIFGCMKGTLTLLPNVDLTEPADPDWGKVYED